MELTKHFDLFEFMPDGVQEFEAPPAVMSNLMTLAETILEPLRAHFGLSVVIHSGWRPPEKNAKVGGVKDSDHEDGAAADFNLAAHPPKASWEDNTIAAFDWLRENMAGAFGQLILEDHREHYGDPGKLWVHVSIKTAKHDGKASDRNRVLVSYAPSKYEQWKDARFA